MLAMLFGFLSGPLLEKIADAYKARLANASSQDKMAGELAAKEIEAEIEARKQATIVNLAEQGNWFTRTPRAIVQWSFALFVGKCVVWDNLLGLGSTDPLQGDISSWAGMVMAMWFGGRTLEKIAQVFGRR